VETAEFFSLKGWKIKAQGNALGKRLAMGNSPERAPESRHVKILSPFQGFRG
jgi:hypothetical protein